jgi:hypothetical protein
MGLGSKLEALNKETSKCIKNANEPISKSGFNAKNLSLEEPENMTSNEIKNVENMYTKIYNNIITIAHLQYPHIPENQDPNKQMINKLIVAKMWRIICIKNLQNFYTQESLQNLVNYVCMHDYRMIMKKWNINSMESALDLSILGLYNIILFVDDSGSMSTIEPKEDKMSRWDILKQVLKTISFWSTLMDDDGIDVRFFNSQYEGNNITNDDSVNEMFEKIRPSGGTPMGHQMINKLFNPFIYRFLNAQQLNKPVLIITITDGCPDNREDVVRAITECSNKFRNSKYGENGIAFSFAQIGSDVGAQKWLSIIDQDKYIGHLIDCTSEFNMEKEECGPDFTESSWIIKLLIGAIDPDYDLADETNNKGTTSYIPPPPYAPPSYAPPSYNNFPPPYSNNSLSYATTNMYGQTLGEPIYYKKTKKSNNCIII